MTVNESTQVPRYHVCFDVETYPCNPRQPGEVGITDFRLGCATSVCIRKGAVSILESITCLRPNNLWDFIADQSRHRQRVLVWSHNLGFDLNAGQFWRALEDGIFSLPRPGQQGCSGDEGSATKREWAPELVTNDPPTIVPVLTDHGQRMVFLDSLNWVRAPLADIGTALSIDKLPMPEPTAMVQQWYAYCRRDVEILVALIARLCRFVHSADLGCFRYTAPAQSMQCFRHLCHDSLPTIDDRPDRKVLERMAYHGGRCEVYFRGTVEGALAGDLRFVRGKIGEPCVAEAGPVYVLDVNGSYPAVMRDNLYPRCHHRDMIRPTVTELENALASYAGVATVCLYSPLKPYPCLLDGRLVWATGRIVTTLCGPELIRAVKDGHACSVDSAQLYTQSRMFGPFVERLWNLRQQFADRGEGMMASLCKTLLNSLHGKFSQRTPRWKWADGICSATPWGEWAVQDKDEGTARQFRSVNWRTQERIPPGEDPQSFPLIAAYVCSYARERMRAVRDAAGQREVLYEDSDSVHVTASGYQQLMERAWIGPGLGQLKVVSGPHEVARYYAPKHYVLDGREVCAGRSRKAIVHADGSWDEDEFLCMDHALSGQPKSGAQIRRKHSSPPADWVPGEVGRDGWVRPFDVEMWR